jgi:hypothetical protein
MYLIIVKPFKDKMINKLEIFNEVTIAIVGYHLFLFTDFI